MFVETSSPKLIWWWNSILLGSSWFQANLEKNIKSHLITGDNENDQNTTELWFQLLLIDNTDRHLQASYRGLHSRMGNWLDSNTALRLPETSDKRVVWISCGSRLKIHGDISSPQKISTWKIHSFDGKSMSKNLVLWCWWWRFIKDRRT